MFSTFQKSLKVNPNGQFRKRRAILCREKLKPDVIARLYKFRCYVITEEDDESDSSATSSPSTSTTPARPRKILASEVLGLLFILHMEHEDMTVGHVSSSRREAFMLQRKIDLDEYITKNEGPEKSLDEKLESLSSAALKLPKLEKTNYQLAKDWWRQIVYFASTNHWTSSDMVVVARMTLGARLQIGMERILREEAMDISTPSKMLQFVIVACTKNVFKTNALSADEMAELEQKLRMITTEDEE